MDGQSEVFVDSTTEFIVDVRSVPRPTGPNKLVCLVTTPEKKLVQAHVDDRFDGTYLVSYTPFDPGSYNVEILFDNIPLSSTPYTVLALEGSDARRVRAHGTGLARGLVGIPGQFVVETKGAGRETVDVSLVGPKEANMNCTENANSSCVFEYVPIESGKYEISIKFGGKDIPGSPFFVLVDYPVDAAKVFATGPGLEPKNCRSGVPLTFQVDASKSGYAPLNVDVLSERGPAIKLPEIRERPNNNYEVVFYPTAEGSTCTVHVTYGGKEIANSPFRMLVLPAFEPQKVLVRGDGIIPLGHIPASVPVSFTVDTTNAGDADMEVLVVGPDSEPVPVKVVDHGDGTYLVSWVPEDTGKYSILVKYGGREVPRSPYKLTSYAVGDASKCVIKSRQENIVIGEEYGIVVDTAHAGEGNITCRIRPNHPHSTLLKVDVDKQQNGTVGIYYTAPNPDQYLITIKFGGRPIPGGEFKVWADTREAIAAAAASRPVVNGHDREHSNFQNGFELPPVEFWNIALPPNSGTKSCSKIEAHVLLPSRKLDFPDIKENQDGSVTVKYQPMEKGLHEMHIKHNGSHVQGSPYQFFVESAHENYVTAYGSGLVYGSVGEKAQFTVSAKQSSTSVAGIEDGGLSVSIEGPAKADITCQDNKDGTCTVSWVPPVAGEYKIHVRFGDSEITGSPFTAKISGDADSRKRAHFAVESRNEVSLKISEADTTDLTATISSPSGVELPCSIRKMDDGHLASGAGDAGISFTPREVGEHLVSVQKGGKLLPASPFQIQISQSEVASAAKVKTTGSGLNTATAKQFNDVFVDTRGAGFGGLSLSIEGPSKCEIRCEDNKDGTCNIQYRPSEPGNYILNLKFADTHVPGSPFNINCQGTVSDNVKETVKHQRKQTTVVAAGQECELCLRITDADVRSMRAQLTSPSGLTRDAEVVPVDRNTVCVRFRPSELGVHTVAVQHKAQQLPGSPFQFTVGPFADGGAEKVRAGGQGLVHGEVNQPASFNIYTREAGAGNLSIAIEGPSKAEIDFKDHKDGNCYVVYTVSKLGTYTVNVKFDDKHIPGSPFKSYISPKPPMVNGSNGHNNRLPEVLFCPPTAILNHPLRFNVATAAKNGSIIDAKVIAPSGAESSCDVSTVGADVYEVGFTPRDTGNHYVHVKVDGNHLPESPILVVVRDDIPDSKQVLVSGQGIKEGFIGKQCEFVINTCNAGPGSLQVTVEGPSKVSLDAVEVEEGYKLRYTPLAPGNYTIIIKYNGEHIPGSPFQTTVDGKLTRSPVGVRESSTFQVSTLSPTNLPTSNLPTTSKLPPSTTSKAPPKEIKDDAARKVVCTGSGLQRAVVGSQNHFTVDTSNAGSDLLWISVVSSRGPIDEVFVKHLGNGLFSVNYLLSERQPCFVYIKLGDKHVPGSPFEVGV